MSKLAEGDKAPKLTLPDQSGSKVNLSDFKGEWVVLYFYPKDMTPGCTQQACDFTQSFPKFKKLKAVILGVSADSIERHQKFIEKYGLKFSLLSDEDLKVCKAYGVYQKKSLYGREFMGIVRTTFVIDPKGVIRKIYPKVKVNGHIKEVENFLTEIA